MNRRFLITVLSIICGCVIGTILTWFSLQIADGFLNRWVSLESPPITATDILGVDFDISKRNWTPLVYIKNDNETVWVCCPKQEKVWEESSLSDVTNWEYNRVAPERFQERRFSTAIDNASLLRKGEWDGTEIHFAIDSDGDVWMWRNDTHDAAVFLLCLWPFWGATAVWLLNMWLIKREFR